MKLIFMGAPDFAVPALQELINSDHKVVAVYTQPPRPAGRGHKLRNTPVHNVAEEASIPVLTPASLKSEEAQATFRAFDADAAIVSAYGLLLPTPILEACEHGCINVHPSKLPRWRGAAPIQRPIMAGDTETAICIMQMNEGLDTGDILAQKDYNITSKMTAGDLHDKLAIESASMLLDILKHAENGTLSPTQQPVDGTYAKKLKKEDGHINFSQTTHEIDCQIRGVTPFPSAYFSIGGEKFKVLKIEKHSSAINVKTSITVDNAFTIACADGTIRPTIIQRQGKKAMNTEALLRGFDVPAGTEIN